METQHLPTTGHQFATRKKSFLTQYRAQQPPESFRVEVPVPELRRAVYLALHAENPQDTLRKLPIDQSVLQKVISLLS